MVFVKQQQQQQQQPNYIKQQQISIQCKRQRHNLTTNQITSEFQKYLKTTQSPGISDFQVYLMKNIPINEVRSIIDQIEADDDLKFIIGKTCENFIIQGMLSGDIKSDAAKQVLKNEHGWEQGNFQQQETGVHQVILSLATPPETEPPSKSKTTKSSYQSIAVSIDGVKYSSVKEAAQSGLYDISSEVIFSRCRTSSFPNWTFTSME